MDQNGTRASERSWRRVAFATASGAAALHFAAARPHLEEYAPAGLFMATAAVAQAVWALWVGIGAPRRVIVAGVTANLCVLAIWFVSRTSGLPFGPMPWTPEHIHDPDALAAVLEVLVIAAGIALTRQVIPRPSRSLVPLAMVFAAASTFVGAHDPTHERMVALATLFLMSVAFEFFTVVRPLGRNHAEATYARRVLVAVRVGVRAGAGARG